MTFSHARTQASRLVFMPTFSLFCKPIMSRPNKECEDLARDLLTTPPTLVVDEEDQEINPASMVKVELIEVKPTEPLATSEPSQAVATSVASQAVATSVDSQALATSVAMPPVPPVPSTRGKKPMSKTKLAKFEKLKSKFVSTNFQIASMYR